MFGWGGVRAQVDAEKFCTNINFICRAFKLVQNAFMGNRIH